MAKKRVRKKPDYPWIVPDLRPLAVAIGELKPDPQNARTHDEANVRAVKKSLRRYGQYHPLLANANNGQVVIGNCRLLAAIELGWSHIAVIKKPMTDAEQARLSVGDNRTAELAEWDDLLLTEALRVIEDEDADQFDLLNFELGLDALLPKRRQKKGETDPQLEGLEYRIIILCQDEEHQAELLTRLEGEGLQCQALIS